MNKKSLIILVPAFPGKESGSFMVPFIQQFLEAFSNNHKNVELIIYSLFIPNGVPYVWKNIKVIPLNGRQSNFFSKLFLVIKSTLIIGREIRKAKVGGILSFWYNETALLGNILSFIYSKKHFTWLLGQDVKRTNPYMKYLRPNPNKLIAISDFQNDYFFKEFGISAKTVNPIAVNPIFFPDLNTSLRKIDILGTGSLIPLKNYQLFLDAVLELRKTAANVKVVLIGNGPMESQFKAFINQNNLENNVSFTGLLSHKQTLNYMNNAKVFLHTSNFEGGGTVLHEALYSGCLVISTIPIIKDINAPFFHCETQEEIVFQLKLALKNNEKFSRFSSVDIKQTNRVVYNLFFDNTF
ncbi:glycosyltransferase [Jejuia spongiicola]|uniref:Glycosyltransferase n=1 Tax=Jejuia spongiicola TaxID=2942207 RepID=A0ABT0QBR3_9FLAO|nr:glycosyltransferase [Jejuia spongiicola]MCL6294422.1 glycosyltransferase [Jejuia spongiicola]